jgi:hypothetical protein
MTYGYKITYEGDSYTLRYNTMPVIYRTRYHWLAKLMLMWRLFKVEWFMFAAIHRINGYWMRKRRRQTTNYMRRPICWFKKHKPYNNGSWGYSATSCSRCQKLLTYKSYRKMTIT